MQIVEQRWGFDGNCPVFPEFVVGGEIVCLVNTDSWTLEMVADRELTREEELFLIEWREARDAKASSPLPAKPAASTPDTTAGGMRLRVVPDGVNPYEYAARVAKARKLAEFLRSHGVDKESALSMTFDHWRTVAKLAGVNEPSATVQMLAIEDLGWMERAA